MYMVALSLLLFGATCISNRKVFGSEPGGGARSSLLGPSLTNWCARKIDLCHTLFWITGHVFVGRTVRKCLACRRTDYRLEL